MYIHERPFEEYKKNCTYYKYEWNDNNRLHYNIRCIVICENIFCKCLCDKINNCIMHQVNGIAHATYDNYNFSRKHFIHQTSFKNAYEQNGIAYK